MLHEPSKGSSSVSGVASSCDSPGKVRESQSYKSTAFNFSETVLKTVILPLKANLGLIMNWRPVLDGGSQLKFKTDASFENYD